MFLGREPTIKAAGTRVVRVLALALALVLGACAGDESAEPMETAETVDSELAQECTNEVHGFTIRYPEGWHTNAGDVVPSCSFFHPEEFEVPEATEATEFAVFVRREPVALDRIAAPSPATEVIEREDVEVAGRDALLREIESTGEGLLPRGTRATQYLVELGGETLVLETYDHAGLAYDDNRRVLRSMAETLELQQ